MGAGDATSQLLVERKPLSEYEWQRTARFFAIGTFFVVSVFKKILASRTAHLYHGESSCR